MQLPPSIENNAAKICINRITGEAYGEYVDVRSKVKNRELLALVYLASKDKDRLESSPGDSQKIFVQCLYEIERGYNLDERGNDDEAPSKPICTSGAFNKLASTFQGCHPVFEIRSLTKATANIKLRALIIEESRRYLIELVRSKEETRIQHIASEADERGVATIYDNIKASISDKIFEEFGELFESRESNKFNKFIEDGKYLYFDDPDVLATVASKLEDTALCEYLLGHRVFESASVKKLLEEIAEIDIKLHGMRDTEQKKIY